MLKPKPLKVLIWDIETAPILHATWSMYPKYGLPNGGCTHDWYIISGAWKELGKSRVHSAAIDPAAAAAYYNHSGPAPDLAVVQALRDAVADADVIIAHNGDSFDLKKLNARIIFWGLEALPSIRTVDTLKEVRKVAAFSKNNLEYLAATLLPDGGKIKTTMQLWMDVIQGRPRAVREMLAYNRKDVTELERVYLRLRPYLKAHPNMVVHLNDAHDTPTCPTCGSKDVQRRGMQRTQTQEYARYHCQGCGSWSRSSRVKGGVLKRAAGTHS